MINSINSGYYTSQVNTSTSSQRTKTKNETDDMSSTALLLSEALSGTSSGNTTALPLEEHFNMMQNSQMGIKDALSAEDFFAKYDTDGDGEITAAEYNAKDPAQTSAASASDTSSAGTDSDSVTSEIDTNGDGSISAEEYEAYMEKLGITDAPSAEDFFAQVDTDSDGEITADELKAQSEKMSPPPPPMPPQDSNNLVSSIDTDDDQSISSDEYESLLSKLDNSDSVLTSDEFFNQYDTNSDGEVSFEELLEAAATNNTTSSSDSTDSLSYRNFAANTLNAYETNYQYMFGTEDNDSENIA